jgi:hypothetical protein
MFFWPVTVWFFVGLLDVRVTFATSGCTGCVPAEIVIRMTVKYQDHDLIDTCMKSDLLAEYARKLMLVQCTVWLISSNIRQPGKCHDNVPLAYVILLVSLHVPNSDNPHLTVKHVSCFARGNIKS